MTEKIDDICLLVGRETVPVWFAEAVVTLLNETEVNISLVVVTENINTAEASDDVQQRTTFERFKRKILTPSFLNRNPVEHRPLSTIDELEKAEWIETDLEPAEPTGVKILSDVVDEIVNRCDLVIHNGVGILQGEILTRPEYGVLSFHHGDIRKYRGAAPTGFWQHLRDEEYAGVTLQRLNEQLDGGQVVLLNQVYIGDLDTWYEVQDRMYSASIPMLKEGLMLLQDPEKEPEIVPDSELGDMYYRSDWTPKARLRSRVKDLVNVYFR